MQRILLAVGMEAFEEAIKREFFHDSDFTFIQRAVVYREAVIPAINDENPDILVLREGLKGGVSVLKLLKNLRMTFNGRIVFIAEEHENNQTETLVKKVSELGVYDVVWGHEIDIDVLCRHIRRPSTYAELMAKLGISSREDEDDEFSGGYTLAKVVKKESSVEFEKKDGAHERKNLNSDESPKDVVVSTCLVPSSRKKEPPVIDGEIVESPDSSHCSDSINFNVQRTSVPANNSGSKSPNQAQSSVSPTHVEHKTSTPQMVAQKPVVSADVEQRRKKTTVPTNVLTSDDLKEMVAAQEKAEQERKLASHTKQKKQNAGVSLPAIPSSIRPQLQKHQSVLFVGSRDGAGCTSIAFNTALMLASEGKKVIYIDFREELPSQVVRLNLNQNYGGLEKFLLEYQRKAEHIDKCCLHLTDDKRFQKLPRLDILGFSINYIQAGTHYKWGGTFAQTVKELTKIYDYVICDSFANVGADAFLSLVNAVTKIAFVTGQDSYYAETMLWTLQHLKSKGNSLDNRTCLIANRFENIRPLEQDMQNYFQIQTVFRMPSDNKGFLTADSITMPYLYGPKRAKNRTYFQKIKNWIQN